MITHLDQVAVLLLSLSIIDKCMRLPQLPCYWQACISNINVARYAESLCLSVILHKFHLLMLFGLLVGSICKVNLYWHLSMGRILCHNKVDYTRFYDNTVFPANQEVLLFEKLILIQLAKEIPSLRETDCSSPFYTSPPKDTAVNQGNPVHILTLYSSSTQNNIPPSTPRSLK